MKDKKKSLYSLAKLLNQEIFMEAQIQTGGMRYNKVLEKYEKNKKSFKTQTIIVKISYAIIFSVLTIIPLMSYFEIITRLRVSRVSSEVIILSGATFFSIFFLLQLMYIILLGMLNTSALMSGNAFKWLETLPLSKKKLQKLSFLTIFRSLDLPLIIMVVIFPLLILIGTQNFLLFLICFLISITNVLFMFSSLVLISERITKILQLTDKNSKKSAALRIITMLGYLAMTFGTIYLIQWAFTSFEIILSFYIQLENSDFLNLIFSLIPFPFSSSYLIILFSVPKEVPTSIWISTMISFILFFLLSLKMYSSAVKSLKSITQIEYKPSTSQSSETISKKDDQEIIIKKMSPVKAYLRKDLVAATRDLQMFMFLIMPILFPFIFVISSILGISTSSESPLDTFMVIWSLLLFSSLINSYMLVSGLLGVEETGISILASLPISPRDQAKAKLLIILIVQTLGFMCPSVLLILLTGYFLLLELIFVSLPMIWIMALIIFEFKILFFGKMKYKYVIEEVNTKLKYLKWFLLAIVGSFIYITIISFGNMIYFLFGLGPLLIALVIFEIISLLIILQIFNKIFPKV
ncbi:MAG: hypothetical protein GF383_11050 [Candidatus Lokiarchaeota archaeon]|nr:hypothetical protein [Candidatus Lokiarchaeota archaeon]MBD3341151.1 hypothetical protein [Candidatus Lokiarchaeota archaeon]